jgi:hypothetical protein
MKAEYRSFADLRDRQNGTPRDVGASPGTAVWPSFEKGPER